LEGEEEAGGDEAAAARALVGMVENLDMAVLCVWVRESIDTLVYCVRTGESVLLSLHYGLSRSTG
jgi:hypothetical protein